MLPKINLVHENNVKTSLADPGFSFGGQVERRRREYRDAAGNDGVSFGRGCPPPQ